MNPPTKDDLRALVIETLRDILEQRGRPLPAPLNGDTPLLGGQSTLDSLDLVGLVTETEQRVADRWDRSLLLADERALSLRRSPFRTVNAFTDHILALWEGQ